MSTNTPPEPDVDPAVVDSLNQAAVNAGLMPEPPGPEPEPDPPKPARKRSARRSKR